MARQLTALGDLNPCDAVARMIVPSVAPQDADADAARLAVCDRVARPYDLDNPWDRYAALLYATEVLAMVGLLGEVAPRRSPGHVKAVGAKTVHGTRSAVQLHVERGQRLCEACRRWAQVNDRKTGDGMPPEPPVREKPATVPHPDAPTPTADGHGTWRAYRAHRTGEEEVCGACAAYLVWWGSRRRKGHGRSG